MSVTRLPRVASPFFALLLLAACGCGESDNVRVGYKPAGKDLARADLHPDRLAAYLARSDLATVGVVRDARQAIAQGRAYRENIKDQRMRDTLATVFLDRRNQLHIVTMREEDCPACGGSGTRKVGMETLEKLRVDFRCLTCEGKKTLDHHVIEKYYVLQADDYSDPEAARRAIRDLYYLNAPADTERYVHAVAADDPRERLAACVWLDRNWIREGVAFTQYQPMLDKARAHEVSEKKEVMVWQFWAGRGLPGEEQRAYYRVYADLKTGKVTRKGFFPMNP